MESDRAKLLHSEEAGGQANADHEVVGNAPAAAVFPAPYNTQPIYVVPQNPHVYVPHQQESISTGPVVGKWKDDLCQCCGAGGCPTFLYALSGISCFWTCLFAKIASRLNLHPGLPRNAFGDGPFQQWFRLMLIFAVLYWIFQIFSNRYSTLAELELIHDNPGMSPTDEHWHPYISAEVRGLQQTAGTFETLCGLVGLAVCILAIVLRQRARRLFRIAPACNKNGDPDGCAAVTEDVCVSCIPCCSACAIAQVARHTDAVGRSCDPCTDPGPCPPAPPAGESAPGIAMAYPTGAGFPMAQMAANQMPPPPLYAPGVVVHPDYAQGRAPPPPYAPAAYATYPPGAVPPYAPGAAAYVAGGPPVGYYATAPTAAPAGLSYV